jgi:hypothetical protein
MMSEITAMEMERVGSAEAAGMSERGVTETAHVSKAATHVAEATAHVAEATAHMAAKSAAVSSAATPAVPAAAAATPAMSTAMGQRRDRRTGCEDRRRGQRYHRLAHRDVSSVCCDKRQLSAGASQVELHGMLARRKLSPEAWTTMGTGTKILK